MTNVAIAFPRNPMQLAHLAFDLQRLAGGRFTLGLGSQIRPHIERRYGVEFDHPVARMREWVRPCAPSSIAGSTGHRWSSPVASPVTR